MVGKKIKKQIVSILVACGLFVSCMPIQVEARADEFGYLAVNDEKYTPEKTGDRLKTRHYIQTLSDGTVLEESVYQYEYDDAGNLIEVLYTEIITILGEVQCVSKCYKYVYDAQGRVVAEVYSNVSSENNSTILSSTYTYSADGMSAIETTSNLTIPSNDISNYTYDANGNVISINKQYSSINCVYDNENRMIGQTRKHVSGNSILNCVDVYDEMNHLTHHEYHSDRRTSIRDYVYDLQGNVIQEYVSIQTPYTASSDTIYHTNTYDEYGRLILKIMKAGKAVGETKRMIEYTYE